jgi:hypothetical protein
MSQTVVVVTDVVVVQLVEHDETVEVVMTVIVPTTESHVCCSSFTIGEGIPRPLLLWRVYMVSSRDLES